MNHVAALCGTVMFLALSAGGQDKKEAPPKGEPKLDRDSYRVKLEVILEPDGEMAVYRVQIWTLEAGKVWLHTKAGNATTEGLLRREVDGKLYRADFVLLALLRAPMKGAKKTELEFRVAVGGDRGILELIDDVDTSTRLGTVMEVTASDAVYKLGTKQRVGLFRAKLLETEVR